MSDSILVRVDRARNLLAEARDATDAKRVVNLAHAAEVYAKRQKMAEEAIGHATAIKVDAMALMGEFLQTSQKNTGTAGTGRPRIGGAKVEPPNHQVKPPTLTESGITKKESMNAQALASIKQKAPEVYEQVRAGKTTVSKARVEVKRQEKREEARRIVVPVDDVVPDRTWEVRHGDCVKLLAAMPQGSIDLVFADPPYNIGFDYGEGHNDKLPRGEYLAWVERAGATR